MLNDSADIVRVSQSSHFDLNFYRSHYSDISEYTDEAAYAHWQQFGETEGRVANSGDALALALKDSELPSDFDVRAYLELNRDVADAVQWPFQAVQHFKEHGQYEGRTYSFWTKGEELNIPQKNDKLNNDLKNEQIDEIFPLGFNCVSYIASNPDVQKSYPTIKSALWHFKNIGHTEKHRTAVPVQIDRNFILEFYGISVPNDISPLSLSSYMRSKLGFDISDAIYCDSTELLKFHGLHSIELSLIFDGDYYRARYMVGQVANRAQALLHFAEHGQYKSYDLSHKGRFDSAFYKVEYPESIETTIHVSENTDFYRHWLEKSIGTNYFPNLYMLCDSLYKISLPETISNTIIALSCKTGAKPSNLLKQLIEDGDCEFLSVEGNTVEFALDMVERFIGLQEPYKADLLCAWALKHHPLHFRGRRLHASMLYANGLKAAAAPLWETFLEDNIIDELSLLRLAEFRAEAGRLEEAADAGAQLAARFPASVNAVKVAQDFISQGLFAAWNKGPMRALGHSYAEGVARIEHSLSHFKVQPNVFRRDNNIKTVAIFSNDDLNQCFLYRVQQKIEQIENSGFTVLHFEYGKECQKLLKNIWNIDLVIAYRLPAFPEIIYTLGKISDFGVPIIYDIDDLIFDENIFPPSYDSYEKQISLEQHAQLALSAPLYRKAMTMADYAMASTPSLLSHMTDHVRSAKGFLHPNALGGAHMKAIKRLAGMAKEGDPRCTIFYGSGTRAHKSAFKDILLPALVRIAAKYEDFIRIVIIGHFGELAIIPEKLRGCFEIREPGGLWSYWEELRNADINLAVLEEGAVVDAKSEIKWLEAAMFGIPSVVSGTATYTAVIEHGETGFLAKSEEEFFDHINCLVSSSEIREAVGAKARALAFENYGPEIMASRMRNIIQDVERQLPKRKKRLLIANVFYAPQLIGGATRVVEDNVREIRQQVGDEWEITILATKEGGVDAYSVDWHVVDGIRVFTITAPVSHDIDRILVDEKMTDPISQCLDEIKPDLVHLHCIQRLTTTLADVIRRRKVPYLLTMHDGWWISPNQFIIGPDGKERLFDLGAFYEGRNASVHHLTVRQRVLDHAAELLTVSVPFADVCRRAGIENVKVIENGVSTIPAVVRASNLTGRVRLGHFGGLELHKGLPRIRSLIQAHKFRNLSLTVLDHSMQSTDCRTEMWNGTPVEIRGRQPQGEIWSLYAETDVFLAPSMWPESYGLVSREALACGCWVLASDRGAVGEPVMHGINGFVVDMDDDRQLMAALSEIDGNPERYMNEPPRQEIRTSRQQALELIDIYRKYASN